MIVGVNELHAGGADVTLWATSKLADGIAGEGDGAVGFEHQNRVGTGLDQSAKISLAAAQRLLPGDPLRRLGR